MGGILRPDARAVPPKSDGGGEWCRLDLLRIEMEASADQGLTHQGQLDEGCDPRYYMNSDEEEEGEIDDGSDDSEGSRRPRSRWVDDEAIEDDDSGSQGETARSTSRKRRRSASGEDQSRCSESMPMSSDLMSSLFGANVVSSSNGGGTSRERHVELGSGGSDEEFDCDDTEAPSPVDDMAEATDRTERELFSVPGVRCVGCVLGPRVLREVDAYVFEAAATTQPDSLWRLAASKYQDCFVAPKLRAGIVAPSWPPDAIRLHYEHHHMNDRLTRIQMCRYLRGAIEVGMRRFTRRDEASGQPDLDKNRTEMMLKLFAAESANLKELASAAACGGPRRTGLTGRPKAGAGDDDKPTEGE